MAHQAPCQCWVCQCCRRQEAADEILPQLDEQVERDDTMIGLEEKSKGHVLKSVTKAVEAVNTTLAGALKGRASVLQLTPNAVQSGPQVVLVGKIR